MPQAGILIFLTCQTIVSLRATSDSQFPEHIAVDSHHRRHRCHPYLVPSLPPSNLPSDPVPRENSAMVLTRKGELPPLPPLPPPLPWPRLEGIHHCYHLLRLRSTLPFSPKWTIIFLPPMLNVRSSVILKLALFPLSHCYSLLSYSSKGGIIFT
jgi:hypothetical protein